MVSPQPKLWGGHVPPVPNGLTPLLSRLVATLNNDYRVSAWALYKIKRKSQKESDKRCEFKTTAEDGERRSAVTCAGRLFHRQAAAAVN